MYTFTLFFSYFSHSRFSSLASTIFLLLYSCSFLASYFPFLSHTILFSLSLNSFLSFYFIHFTISLFFLSFYLYFPTFVYEFLSFFLHFSLLFSLFQTPKGSWFHIPFFIFFFIPQSITFCFYNPYPSS